MGKYRAYSEYKDSGVEWLGEVPSHWRLEKAKFLFDRKQRPVRVEDGVVTAFRDGEVTLRSKRRETGFTNSLKEIGYQGVRVGDLLIHAMDGFAGAIGVSDSDGKCSPVCSVCVPAERYGVHTSYYGRLLRHMALTDYITALAKGIRERSTEFRFNEFKELSLAVPPQDEQTQIAIFLDHETAKIDRLIAKQEALIELLKEKRQAVISHAVTKGLDPDVPMKDSGVEWLGEIPEGWETKQVRHASRLYRGKFGHRPRNDPKFYDGNHPFIQTGDVAQAQKYIVSHKQTLNDLGASVSQKFPKGTLMMAIAANVGDLAILSYDAYCPDSIVGFKPEKCSVEYLRYALIAARDDLLRTATQNTQMNLNIDRISCVKICIPSAGEQNRIVDHLDSMLLTFRETIATAKCGIDLLQERRTALISAAVTGKIDVREAL